SLVLFLYLVALLQHRPARCKFYGRQCILRQCATVYRTENICIVVYFSFTIPPHKNTPANYADASIFCLSSFIFDSISFFFSLISFAYNPLPTFLSISFLIFFCSLLISSFV